MNTDRMLRAKGFKIKARPKDGEPLWELRGVGVFKESEALAKVIEWETNHGPKKKAIRNNG